MSDSKKFLAPAAIAAALAAGLVPTEAHASKKLNCEKEFKPDLTLKETSEKEGSLSAKVTGAGGGGASSSTASSSEKQAQDPEMIAKKEAMYAACLLYKKGEMSEADWDAAKRAYTLGALGAAPAPAAPAPAGTAPAAGGTAAPVVIVQPPPSSSSTSTAPAKEAKGGGGGKGGLIVGIVAAVAVVVVVIATIAHFSDGSGKDEESELGGDTGTAMIVAPDQASIAIV